jgi:hypothetical protein
MFKSIKGLLFEEDPAQAAAPQAAPAQTAAAPAAIPTQPGQAAAAPIATSPKQAIVEAIRKATMSRNTAYTQLARAADALHDLIPDQVMRLKAAYRTSGAGRTAQQIAEAIDIHLQDIGGEELRFHQMIESKLATEVEGRRRQAQAAADAARSAHEQIQALEKLIIEKNEEATRISGEAAQVSLDLQQSHADFKLAAAQVRSELEGAKALIISTTLQ